jgi:phosphoribosylanthranilate isomerase
VAVGSTAQPRVKICCISSVEEGRLAISYGAAALGLVSEMPSGPGVISERLIGEIAGTVPPGVASFLLTSRQSAAAIIDQQRRVRVNTVQICDRLTDGTYGQLREAQPGVSLVQVVHVTGEELIAEATEAAPLVDGILLDSGNRTAVVKEFGGTGRRHDWQISRRIRESVPVPLYLAGGLGPENVAEAIETVDPFGVDVCNGVRTNGRLDEVKLAAFFQAVRATAQQHRPADARHAARR